MKTLVLLFSLVLFSFTLSAQKGINQEEIKRKQEEEKKANNELRDRYLSMFSPENSIAYSPEYIDELAIRYDISILQFIEFQDFLNDRKAAYTPFLFKNEKSVYDIKIDSRPLVSPKVYPYYGQVMIKQIDSRGNESGTYGYIYDTKEELKADGNYIKREFKATTKSLSSTNNYIIYCDGKKVASYKYTTDSKDITSYETREGNEGMGILGTLLQILITSYLETSEINGFEDELYRIAQQNTCFYEGDVSKKGKQNAELFFAEASDFFKKSNYYAAIKKLDASIWAENNVKALEMRGDIFSRFNSLPDTYKDYTAAIKLANETQNVEKLQILYRKMAILHASLRRATHFKMDDKSLSTIYPKRAVDYIKKAAENGDEVSKKLLGELNSNDILEKIKHLEQ